LFFFSSRRRHTRFSRDWSSDVCSSDLPIWDFGFSKSPEETLALWGEEYALERLIRAIRTHRPDVLYPSFDNVPSQHGHHRAINRSEERRVGKEGRAREPRRDYTNESKS